MTESYCDQHGRHDERIQAAEGCQVRIKDDVAEAHRRMDVAINNSVPRWHFYGGMGVLVALILTSIWTSIDTNKQVATIATPIAVHGTQIVAHEKAIEELFQEHKELRKDIRIIRDKFYEDRQHGGR